MPLPQRAHNFGRLLLTRAHRAAADRAERTTTGALAALAGRSSNMDTAAFYALAVVAANHNIFD